jgi:uncharacterized protein with HEPN domain
MAELSARDAALLLDIRLAAQDALEFVSGISEAEFLASRLHQYAVIRSLEIIGEAASKLSAATQAARPGTAWREMIGMRHRLIHGYAEVRIDLVWRVVQAKLPALIEQLADIA